MRIFITGSQGMLGHRLTETVSRRGHKVLPYDRPDLELGRPEEAAALLLAEKPDLLIHAAAMTDVDGCETAVTQALQLNGEATGQLAAAAAGMGIGCIYISTDYVFNGRKETPYLEDDPTGPASVYGRSKLLGEQEMLAHGAAVVRLSWSFGPDGKNFVATISNLLRQGKELRVVDDQRGCPTYTRDAAEAILDLAEKGGDGIYHLCNEGETTWFGFAQAIAEGVGVPPEQVQPCKSDEYPRPAPRPASSVLGGNRLKDLRGSMPHWTDALERYLEEEEWLKS